MRAHTERRGREAGGCVCVCARVGVCWRERKVEKELKTPEAESRLADLGFLESSLLMGGSSSVPCLRQAALQDLGPLCFLLPSCFRCLYAGLHLRQLCTHVLHPHLRPGPSLPSLPSSSPSAQCKGALLLTNSVNSTHPTLLQQERNARSWEWLPQGKGGGYTRKRHTRKCTWRHRDGGTKT